MENCLLIKEELNSLDKEKRDIFLQYFTKSLEEFTTDWQYSGEFTEDESKEEYYIGCDQTTFKLNENSKPATLKFNSIWKKGTVESIEAFCDDNSINWVDFLKNKVTQSLASAFGQKVESFFFRKKYYYIGNKLDGDYFIQNWRISPATSVSNFYSESVLYFDMKVEGINTQHAYSIYDRFSKEIMALLSVILNKGIYEGKFDFRWAGKEGESSILLQLGYRDETIYPEDMPAKDREKLGKFIEPKEVTVIRDIKSNLCPPNNIRKLFRAYHNLESREKEAFLSASRMFQLALSLGNHMTTVNVSYQIAALDSLSKLIRENNKNKNAILSLVRQYCPKDEIIVGKMYDSIRSAHFHQGHFSERDTGGFSYKPFMGPDYLYGQEDSFLFSKITRNVLISWLTDRISD
ncbi:hypothetical protein QE429_003424 [Bacillus sp. SORGH_AS 510]|uniref:hypothetical protein n=1 Tax=Bacillus sp. SORGH_AS_0510 TaxID=3041771 RepID=UPI0027805AEF|nr:hypothetical protein [Bacillus sp. SORGH_AS_0510]MDQ1146597.1 hypothetical protein [Bacillus sp. SORGH_AS_0510]